MDLFTNSHTHDKKLSLEGLREAVASYAATKRPVHTLLEDGQSEFTNRIAPEYEQTITLESLEAAMAEAKAALLRGRNLYCDPVFRERFGEKNGQYFGVVLITNPYMLRATAMMMNRGQVVVVDLRTDEERAEDAKRFAPVGDDTCHCGCHDNKAVMHFINCCVTYPQCKRRIFRNRINAHLEICREDGPTG